MLTRSGGVRLMSVVGGTDTSGVKDEHGFTLIELMTVILIIAVLVVIALPTFLGARTQAHDRVRSSRGAETA